MEARGLHCPPLKKYRLLRVIGSGTFGTVYLWKKKVEWFNFPGSQQNLELFIAVKEIAINGPDTYRELEILIEMKHDNIVKLLGVELERSKLFLKMEVAQCDLSKLKELFSLVEYPVTGVNCFAYQILGGLSYLHERSIAHRDVKPQNILAFWEGATNVGPGSITSITLKLSDFGLSRFVPANSVTATAVGSSPYMAPEVARAFCKQELFRGDYRRADVFSAGAVIHELLFGERPFAEDYLMQENEVFLLMDIAEVEVGNVVQCLKQMLWWSARERTEAHVARYHFYLEMVSSREETIRRIIAMQTFGMPMIPELQQSVVDDEQRRSMEEKEKEVKVGRVANLNNMLMFTEAKRWINNLFI